MFSHTHTNTCGLSLWLITLFSFFYSNMIFVAHHLASSFFCFFFLFLCVFYVNQNKKGVHSHLWFLFTMATWPSKRRNKIQYIYFYQNETNHAKNSQMQKLKNTHTYTRATVAALCAFVFQFNEQIRSPPNQMVFTFQASFILSKDKRQ